MALVYDDEVEGPAKGVKGGRLVFDDEPTPETRKGSAWDTAKDLGASALGGLTAAAKLPAMAIDKAVSGQWFGPGATALNEFGEAVDAQKSDELQRREQERQNVIRNAGRMAQSALGGGDGVVATTGRELAEAGASAYTVLSDPRLLSSALASQIGMLGVTRMGGRAADATARAAAGAAPRVAETVAGRAAVAGAGTAGAVGTGAALQGADVGGDAYERLVALPDELWAQVPHFADLARELGPQEAKEALASDRAFMAAVQGGAVSVLSSMLPGGAAMERALVGKVASAPGLAARGKAVGRAMVGEGRQEAIEEGLGRVASNEAVAGVDPTQDRYAGVGSAAGEGAALGAALGGGITASRVARNGPAAPAAEAGPAPATVPLPGAGPVDAGAGAGAGAAAGGAAAGGAGAAVDGVAVDGARTSPAHAQLTDGAAQDPLATQAPHAEPAPTPARPSGAEIRLAELEIAAQAGGLPEHQQAELQRLRAAVSSEGEASAAASGAPDAGRPAGLSNGEAQTKPPSTRDTPARGTPFWRFAEAQGVDPSTLLIGSPQWAQMRQVYGRAKAEGNLEAIIARGPVQATRPDLALQNRDRTRAASISQMQAIAQSPDYGRLGISRSPEAGAPMVFAVADDLRRVPPENYGREDVAVMSDGQRVPFRYAVVDALVVEPSNFADGTPNPGFAAVDPGVVKALSNGRTAGLRAAHELGNGEGYVAAMLADSQAHGVPLDAIASTPNPMLVRVYSERSNTPGMAARSQGQALGLSAPEQARLDASLIDESVLAVYTPGDIAGAANRDFVRAFVGQVSRAGQDISTLMADDGSLSVTGRQRLRAALLQAAYEDGDLVQQLFESTEPDMKAVGEALTDAAGGWAAMRAAVRAGAIHPDADITGNLRQALDLVRQSRRSSAERRPLAVLVKQIDLMTGQPPDPLTIGALSMMYSPPHFARAESRQAIASALRDYVRAAMTTTPHGDLLGDSVEPMQVLMHLQRSSTDESEASQRTPGTDRAAGGGALPPGAADPQPRPARDGARPGRHGLAAASPAAGWADGNAVPAAARRRPLRAVDPEDRIQTRRPAAVNGTSVEVQADAGMAGWLGLSGGVVNLFSLDTLREHSLRPNGDAQGLLDDVEFVQAAPQAWDASGGLVHLFRDDVRLTARVSMARGAAKGVGDRSAAAPAAGDLTVAEYLTSMRGGAPGTSATSAGGTGTSTLLLYAVDRLSSARAMARAAGPDAGQPASVNVERPGREPLALKAPGAPPLWRGLAALDEETLRSRAAAERQDRQERQERREGATPAARRGQPGVRESSDRFPAVATITDLHVGPGGRIQPRPIAPGQPLYRETSAAGLDDLLRLDPQAEALSMFVTDNRDLAIGQGSNRGVMVTFRPDSLSGRVHAKPMTGDLAGREYRTDMAAPRAVQTIEMAAADITRLRMLTRRRLAAEFDRQALPGGQVRFQRKGLSAEAAPPSSAEPLRRYAVGTRERDVYAATEPGSTSDVPLDLFPESLTDLQPVPGTAGGADRQRGRRAAADRDLRPAAELPPGIVEPNTLALRQDPALPGVYHYSTQLVEVGRRELPVARVTNWQEAASALQALRRFAVEHFDVLVTDASGRPLAVVGAFKGAQSQAAVYPATLLQEALRIKGAAHAWGVHNHPSGVESLSSADRHLSGAIARVFGPSSVEWMGLAAVGDGRFEAVGADGANGAATPVSGALLEGGTKTSVPIVERTIAPANRGMPVVDSPAKARQVVAQASNGEPGIVFVDSQHRLTAWVPLEPRGLVALRQGGRFDRLINAASQAGAGAAFIANPNGVIGLRALQNVVNALGLADIRVLDAIDVVSGQSDAERGVLPSAGSTVLSRAPATATPAFKAWFGGSKITGPRGVPRVMYHGTGADISTFRAQKAGAIFVTDEPIFAHGYADHRANWMRETGQDGGANILPVFVKAERPFDYEVTAHVDAVVATLQVPNPDGYRKLLRAGNWKTIESPKVQAVLRALGHDGFWVSESGFKNLGVYEPTQIKSAVGNRGTFDPAAPDIRFSDTRGAAAGGIAMSDLLEVSGRVVKVLPGLPKVNVMRSPADLDTGGAQGRLREQIDERGATVDAEGALHEGEIYLFASGIADKLRAEHVLAEHEAAHAGLRGVLGGQLPRTMRAIANRNVKVRAAAAALMKADPSLSLIEAVEEIIVDMPSTELVKLQGWRLLVERARDWFQGRGFNAIAEQLDKLLQGSMADQQRADLFVADLVRAARAYVAGEVVPNAAWGPALQAAQQRAGAADASAPALAAAAGATPTPADSLSATARAVFSRNSRRGETESGRPLPQPDPDDPNPWTRAKAKVMALTDPKTVDKLIYEFQDRYIDLKRIQQHIKAMGGVLNDLNDAYLGEELYHRRLATRTTDFMRDELRPMLEQLNARGVTPAEFEHYLHARHAPEANQVLAERNPNATQLEAKRREARRIVDELATQLEKARRTDSATRAIEEALTQARSEAGSLSMAQPFKGTEAERLSLSGMSDAQAEAYIAALPAQRLADLKALAVHVDAINARTLKLLEDYGLMSKASLDAWRAAYQYYVPLHRDEAHADSHAHPIGSGFSVKGDAARARVGSNEKVTHILGHLAMQREAALTRGEKNGVVKRLYLLAAQNPDPELWSVERLPTVKTVDPGTGFVRTGVDPRYKTLPNVVMLRVGGRDMAITFNEHNPQALRLAEAVKNLDVGDLHVVLGLAAKGTRWFASVNTQYNPIFGLVNFARDVQAGLLNMSTTEIAGKQAAVAAGLFKAMRAIYRTERGKTATDAEWTRLWRELQEVGGTTGFRDLFTDANDRAKKLQKQLDSLSRGDTSKAAHAIVDWLSDYNETMENAVRLAAYRVALDQGMSKVRAASLAKNLTVNFNRKGRQTREIGALMAFWNSAVQGSFRLAETLRGPLGKKIMFGGVALGAFNTLLGMAVMGGGGEGDDEWEKIPSFVKERSLIIPLGRQDYVSIPLPLGFHVFPNIGRNAVEMAFGNSGKSKGRHVGEMLLTIADAFNPLGSSDLGQMATPTVVDPVVALWRNRDWTGRPIYLENRNQLDPQPGHAQAKNSASSVSSGLARAINAITGGTEYRPGVWSPTPDQIDYVIGQLTGGVGRELLKANQAIAAPFTGDELPAHKVPLVGRFYGNTRGTAGSSERFYDNVRELNEIDSEIKGRLRDGGDVAGFRADEPLVALIGRGNAVEVQVRELRKERRQIEMRAPPGYQDRLREIDERIASTMARFNTDVLRARQAPAAASSTASATD